MAGLQGNSEKRGERDKVIHFAFGAREGKMFARSMNARKMKLCWDCRV